MSRHRTVPCLPWIDTVITCLFERYNFAILHGYIGYLIPNFRVFIYHTSAQMLNNFNSIRTNKHFSRCKDIYSISFDYILIMCTCQQKLDRISKNFLKHRLVGCVMFTIIIPKGRTRSSIIEHLTLMNRIVLGDKRLCRICNRTPTVRIESIF